MSIEQLVLRGAQCTRIRCATAVLLFLLGATTAAAHDFWIEPQKFRARVGESIPLRLLVGQDFKGEPALYNPAQFERYLYVGSRDERSIEGELGDDPAGSIAIDAPGAYVVGYYSKQFEVTFDTLTEFEQYLHKEGLEHNLLPARRQIRWHRGIVERYTRCAKSLIATEQTGGEVDRALGFPLELIAETNPFRQRELRVRLTFRGQPLAGALVTAFSKNAPLQKSRIRTDKDGRAVFTLDRTGPWLVTSVHQIPRPWYASGDWESFWASLTFERPAGR